jgi:hypothetical protein
VVRANSRSILPGRARACCGPGLPAQEASGNPLRGDAGVGQVLPQVRARQKAKTTPNDVPNGGSRCVVIVKNEQGQ